MPQRPFAGSHTERKLDKLEAYLKAYLTVLKNRIGCIRFTLMPSQEQGQRP